MAASEPLDPELAAAIEAFEAAGVPPWHSLSVAAARRLEDELFSAGSGPELEAVRDLAIDGPGGELPLRAYRPAAEDPPTVVFYHGGGWALGTLDSADDICRELAARIGALVLSVDYRLAPEHPFPAALDDAFAALQWASLNAAGVGGDPDRLAVAGTSAGGHLAAGTARRARERGPDLAAQGLLYPIVDPAMDTAAYAEHADSPLLSAADMAWFWDLFLRSPADRANPYVDLAAESVLGGLPPAVVATAGHDVLRDEGIAYADRLADAGVPTDHLHYPTLAHGFLSLTDDVAAADAAMDAVAERFRARLAP